MALESSGHGGGDGDRVKLVSLISLVELLISSKDLSLVIQLHVKPTVKTSIYSQLN